MSSLVLIIKFWKRRLDSQLGVIQAVATGLRVAPTYLYWTTAESYTVVYVCVAVQENMSLVIHHKGKTLTSVIPITVEVAVMVIAAAWVEARHVQALDTSDG